MGMTLKTQSETDLLRVTLGGEFTMPEAKQTFLQILDAAAQANARRILVDGREVRGTLSTVERYELGEFVALATLDRVSSGAIAFPRIACVLVEPVLDPQRFGEMVARNRGAQLSVFANIDDAVAWLEKPA